MRFSPVTSRTHLELAPHHFEKLLTNSPDLKVVRALSMTHSKAKAAFIRALEQAFSLQKTSVGDRLFKRIVSIASNPNSAPLIN